MTLNDFMFKLQLRLASIWFCEGKHPETPRHIDNQVVYFEDAIPPAYIRKARNLPGICIILSRVS